MNTWCHPGSDMKAQPSAHPVHVALLSVGGALAIVTSGCDPGASAVLHNDTDAIVRIWYDRRDSDHPAIWLLSDQAVEQLWTIGRPSNFRQRIEAYDLSDTMIFCHEYTWPEREFSLFRLGRNWMVEIRQGMIDC